MDQCSVCTVCNDAFLATSVKMQIKEAEVRCSKPAYMMVIDEKYAVCEWCRTCDMYVMSSIHYDLPLWPFLQLLSLP